MVFISDAISSTLILCLSWIRWLTCFLTWTHVSVYGRLERVSSTKVCSPLAHKIIALLKSNSSVSFHGFHTLWPLKTNHRLSNMSQ